MFDHIRGKLVNSDSSSVVIEAQGVGFKLYLPANEIAKLPSLGKEILLFTALFFKEPLFELFGFLDHEMRALFYRLNQVNGIGARSALNILSAMQPAELFQCIHQEDSAAIARIPSIGKKTAQRLILEMKGSFSPICKKEGILKDALLALQKLGFPEAKAQQVVDQVYQKNKQASLEKLITQSLKQLS